MNTNIKTNKKIKIMALVFAVVLLAVLFFGDFSKSIQPANADVAYQGSVTAPYQTYTAGPENSIVTTQTAYTPQSRIALDGMINMPQDMIVDNANELIYIADTGNKRILVVSLDNQLQDIIGGVDDENGETSENLFKNPTGIAIGDNKLFVCDKGDGSDEYPPCVFIFDIKEDNDGLSYKKIARIIKPDNPLVGKNTPYVPTKLTVDARGNMYIVSEGCANGLMQVALRQRRNETTDGETTDSETTDGETTDSETTDGETTDGETTDGETTDSETTDGETTDSEQDNNTENENMYYGEFVGYVGANETPASLANIFKNLFSSFIDDSEAVNRGKSPSNVSIDSRGLVYTVTKASTNSIKKLNTIGNSIMSPSINYASTVDVAIDASDNIYSIQSDGYVTIFDGEGNLLFRFGPRTNAEGEAFDEGERLGLLQNPVAISVLQDGRIIVLDSTYNMAIVYKRTDFANLLFNAVDYYKDGLYLDGEDEWQKVLTYNSNFILAYKALAKANMKRGDYDTALTQFKYAEDRQGYSDAYWQIRNEWLENNLTWVIIVVLVIIAGVTALKILDKKKPKIFLPIKSAVGKVGSANIKGVYFFKEFKHMGRFCKKTPDAVFETKYHQAASVWTAGILLVWFVVLQILSVVMKGYLFNSATVYNTNGLNLVLTTTGALLLLVLCNYFVSTVTDGEGKLKYCFVTFMYALSPYLIMAIPVFIISNVLTFNESVIYYFLEIVMYGWSAICIFRGIMELHDYSFGKTIKNILLTVFAFAMVLLFVVVFRMLFEQLFGYLGSVIGEVFA